MRIRNKILIFLLIAGIITGVFGVTSVYADTSVSTDINNRSNEGTYEYYYTTYGSAKANNTMLEELYITLEGTLTYALRDDARKSYSFSQAWSASKDAGNYFEDVFRQTDENGNTVNYYNNVYQFYRANKNADGYARVTEEIIPSLEHIAAKLKSLQSADLWPALCYYKESVTEGKENPYKNDPLLGELKLVYGDENLKDSDAFVLLVMGDGFTNSERDKLYLKATEFAAYLMNTDPFSDFTSLIKIYALAVDSNESGVSRDTDAYEEADKDIKDTYFGTSFWCGGMQRLISVSPLGQMKMNSLMRYGFPDADYAGLLVNSERYGGSGGTYCTCSLNESASEIFIHEIAHTIADLADEYYAGNSYFGTHPNMSNQKKIENLPWADFYGLPGIGKYAYVDDLTEEIISYGGTNWFKPGEKTCKMEILWSLHEDGSSTPVPFCAVCSEALRKAISRNSNVTHIIYQPYNVVFKDDGLAYKLSAPNDGFEYKISDYIFIRKGSEEVKVSSLNASEYKLEIRNAAGEVITKPVDVGVYTVSLDFSGNAKFDAQKFEFSFEIVSFKKEKGFIGCVEEVLNAKDYSEKYALINKALSLYDTVNHEDASVIAAKETLDAVIVAFNQTVDNANSDAAAAMSVTSNAVFSFVSTPVLLAALCAILKKYLGGIVK